MIYFKMFAEPVDGCMIRYRIEAAPQGWWNAEHMTKNLRYELMAWLFKERHAQRMVHED